MALLDARAVGDFDIGSGQGHSLGEIAQMLAQQFGPSAVVELGYASSANDALAMVPELAKLRVMDLVYQRRDLGPYGLGRERSVEDFARLSGINYLTKRIVHPYQDKPYTL